MQRCDQWLHIGFLDVGGDVVSSKLPVNLAVCGVTIGVVFNYPAVEIHSRVQRLCAIANIVAKPSGIEKNRGFNRLCIFVLCALAAIVTQGSLQPLPYFVRDIGLETDSCRLQVARLSRMGETGGINCSNEFISAPR